MEPYKARRSSSSTATENTNRREEHMNELRSDEEQVEALKSWWRENGKSIVVGLLIGLLGVWGWRLWGEKKETGAQQASIAYQRMLTSATENKPKAAKELGQELINNHAGSAYGVLTALLLAKIAAEDGDLEKAVEHLRWASTHTQVQALATTAQLRLARVLLSQGKATEAWDLLSRLEGIDDLALYQETKGDALVALDKKEEARKSYQRALTLLSPLVDKSPLEMKIDNLGLDTETAAR
jgi:predicted negative regulator of RcsB-dependent stress response